MTEKHLYWKEFVFIYQSCNRRKCFGENANHLIRLLRFPSKNFEMHFYDDVQSGRSSGGELESFLQD